jgi:hypothetical protein
MTQSSLTDESPVAVVEGANGKAEIYEKIVDTIIEYTVKFNGQTKVFNNLGEAYIEAGDLAGTGT